MSGNSDNISRRDLLIRSAFITAGSLLGSSLLLKPFAHAAAKPADIKPNPEFPNPKIAIIIDDVGFNPAKVKPFLHLGAPVTFSILPHLSFSKSLAEKIHAAGHEVMLHQPMEPHSRQKDPGPGALYLAQSSKDMLTIIEKNLSSFPYAVGFNNHMGSRFTESRPKMSDVLKFFREKEFFFVDSFTSRHSIAFDTARNMHITAACRNEFLDNTLERKYIYSQLLKLKAHALKYGYAIGIGHPRPETVKALTRFIDEMKVSGLSLVYASRIVCA